MATPPRTGTGAGNINLHSARPLSEATKTRIANKLKQKLNEELSREDPSLGLKPGDMVAISSSIGQSISF